MHEVSRGPGQLVPVGVQAVKELSNLGRRHCLAPYGLLACVLMEQVQRLLQHFTVIVRIEPAALPGWMRQYQVLPMG